MSRRPLYFLSVFFALFTMTTLGYGENQTVFGPKYLTISDWHLHFSRHSFHVDDPGNGMLVVEKKTPGKDINGGFLFFNRRLIPLRQFLRGDEPIIYKDVALRSTNRLIVFLRGTANAAVTIEIRRSNSPTPPPDITFLAEPMSIAMGEASTLSWQVVHADIVMIDHDVGEVFPNGSEVVTPQETTTYLLAAIGPGGTTSESVTVTVTQLPPTAEIEANPESIHTGESADLSWTSANADSCVIEPDIGVVDRQGWITLWPTETTSYTIVATGPGGTATDSIVVTVTNPAPAVEISADPDSIHLGESATLSWSSSHADSCVIEPDIGPVALTGSTTVWSNETTAYTITATGPGGTVTASATVVIANSAPVAHGQAVTTDEDTGASITLTGSDADGDPLTYSLVSPPIHGALAGTPPDLAYAPDPNFHGSDSFTFNANDGVMDSEPAVVAITVAAINDRPAAADDMAATDEDIPTTTANVLANDSDVDGDTLGVSSYTQPANGTVTSHGDGTFIYTPNPDFNGMDGFTYAAQDHEGAIDTAAVSVFVSPVNDAPAAQAGPDQPAMAGDTVWLDGSASHDVDGDTLAYEWSFVSMPEESGATLSDPSLVNPTFVVDVSGTYELQLVVHDGTVQSAPDTIIVTATPRIVEVPDILGLSQAEAQASILAADLAVGNSTAQNSETVPEGHVMSQNPAAGALAEEGSSVDLVISLGPVSTPPTVSISATPGVIQPGDSATLTWNSTNGDRGFMEPAMGPVAVHGSSTVFPTHTTTYTITVTGPFGSASAQAVIIVTGNPKPQPEGTFGEQYEDLVPSDATVESYNPGRFSLITGVVQDREGVPIAQTAVTIHGHPEYGTASTDAQGRFSIPVEGGATVTVSYQKAGLLGLHRKVYVQWNDIAVLEAVEMIPQDPASTTVTFDGNPDTVICHQSTAVTDSFGSRSCTMVFTGDTRAYLVDDSGNDVHELTTITTRATEFSSPGSMPARLPPNSAYTYCVEPIVDGVPRVRFDGPVIMWVDNFLGFAVGDAVPVGYYDRDRGLWVPYDNGTVVALLDTDTDGLVDALDAHGDGQADDLNGNGSFSDEVAGLDDPERYAPGASFWRVSVPHFTPWDCNWPYGPPSGATAPNASGIPQGDQQKEEALDCPDPNSSIVEQRSRIFHEDIPVAGTALTLHYASNRVEGYKALITVPASGDTVPDSLKRIVVKVNLAGRVLEQILDPICNQTAEIVWDGKDHLGRPLAGSTAATVSVGFVYDAMYYKPGDFAQAFAQAGTEITGIRARQEIISWKRSNSVVVANPKGTIAEGWTLSAHHGSGALVPETLYKGDGSTIRHNVHIIDTVAGDGTYGYSGDGQSAILAKLTQPFYVAVDAENNLFIADYFNHAIRKVDTDGIITTVANVSSPHAVALDAGGNLYIASSGNNRIYRVDTNGAVTPVAGTGMAGYSGDEGPATNAGLSAPHGVAIGPGGNLYIADSFNHRIRKVDTNGIITTVAGTGVSGYRGDGGPATDARLSSPQDIAVDRWGSLYIADGNNYRIRKVDTNGIIATLAGTGTSGFRGDGGPAIQARLDMVYAVATDGTGNLYIADSYNHRIRKVDTNGIITTVTGTGPTGWGQGSYSGDGGMAVDACLRTPFGVALNPAGHLYIADTDNYRIRKVAPPSGFMNVMGAGDMAFADEDGLGYVLNSAGQHKVTLDLDTGAILRQFIYDQNGQLISMADRFGSQITIDRDIDGLPVAIISPDGIMTSLSVDAKNHLSGIIYPDGSTFTFEYTEDGLMSAKVESEGNRFEHLFDATGRLTDATDDLGGNWHYERRAYDNGDVLTEVLTGEGNLTSYLDHTGSTGAYTSVITNPTGGETLFSRSYDGLSVQKSLPCAMGLVFQYDVDREYKFKYLKQMQETTPSGLTRNTLKDKTYEDLDSDDIPDVITETMTVNDKATTVVNNVAQSEKLVTSPAGRSVTTVYNPATLLISRLSVSGFHDTICQYDSRGRLKSMATHARETTLTYNAKGFLESITSPEGYTTAYSYDAVGRVLAVNRPDGSSVSFAYDRNGNVTVLTNPRLVDHAFGYNAVNRNSSYQTPLSGSYQYLYDKDRRLIQTLFPSGNQIDHIYANGRLEQIQTPEGNIDLTYVCGTKLASMANGTTTITYEYDGKLVTSQTLTGTLNHSVSYAYDSDFNPTSFSYAEGTQGYAYDDDGLLTRAGDYTIDRNAGNGLPELITGGTLRVTRTFSPYGELDGKRFIVNGDTLSDWALTRDDAGRIIHKTETCDGAVSNLEYTYDPMGRILSVTMDGSLVEAYQYSGNGTRTYDMNAQRGIAGRTFDYSDEDHLLASGDTTYQYNEDGFLTTKTDGTDMTIYDYSSRGELLSVTLPDGTTMEYAHDPLGRRIAKKVNGMTAEKYFWQGLTRLLAVYDGNDNLITRLEYADGPTPAAMTQDGSTYYLDYDQVGSLRLVADASGNVVKRIDYDTFGNVIVDTNPSFPVPFGFAGGLHDRDTGLVRFGYRDYDPDVGRWTAKDPVLFAGGDTDLYGYCLNDPVNLVDATGLLAANWHFGITYAVARNIGQGFWESTKLAWDAMVVDFQSGSQGTDPQATVQHAMAATGQTSYEAISASEAYVRASISKGNLADAIHAAQDLATPLHAGHEWLGFGWNWESFEHMFGDVFPSFGTVSQALQHTREALKQSNPCSE